MTDSRTLERLIAALGVFNSLDRKMQVSTILTLLEVAAAEQRGEPISISQIEGKVGLLSGTSTRNARYWEAGHQDVRGGHRLVSIHPDPHDARRRLLTLTNEGRAFVQSLKKAMELNR